MIHAKELKDPVIISGRDSYYPFLNLWFILRERKGPKNLLDLNGCRLSRPEWEAGKADDCIKRIEKMTEKYDRWLKEAKEEKNKTISSAIPSEFSDECDMTNG